MSPLASRSVCSAADTAQHVGRAGRQRKHRLSHMAARCCRRRTPVEPFLRHGCVACCLSRALCFSLGHPSFCSLRTCRVYRLLSGYHARIHPVHQPVESSAPLLTRLSRSSRCYEPSCKLPLPIGAARYRCGTDRAGLLPAASGPAPPQAGSLQLMYCTSTSVLIISRTLTQPP